MSSYRPYSSHSTRYPPSTYGSSYVTSDPFYDEDEDELLYGGRTYHRAIPGIAHKRLTLVSSPPHSVKSNRIYSELERSAYRPRVMINTYGFPEEDLDSPTMLILNEKIRDIRMQAQNLLDKQSPSRFDSPVRRPVAYYTSSQYEIPDTRYDNEYKVHTLRGVQRGVQEQVFKKSLYNEPIRRANIGKGHLSCMTFAGGKPQAIRRKKYIPEVDQDKVLNDVTYLSYYDKTQSEVNRQQTDSQLLRHRKVPYGETSYQGTYNIRTYPVPPMDVIDKKYYYGDAYFKGVYGTPLRLWATIVWNLQDVRYATTRGKLLSAHALHSLKIEPIQVKQYKILMRGRKTKEPRVPPLGDSAMSAAARQAAANEEELNRLDERARRIRQAKSEVEDESVKEKEPRRKAERRKQIKEVAKVKEVALVEEEVSIPQVEPVRAAEAVLEAEPVKVVEVVPEEEPIQPVQEPVKEEEKPVPERTPDKVEEAIKPKKKKKSTAKQPVETTEELVEEEQPGPPVQETAPVSEAQPEPEPLPATPAEEIVPPVEEPATETIAKTEAPASVELEIPLEGVSEEAVVQTVQSAIDLTEPPSAPTVDEAETAKKEEPVSEIETETAPEKAETTSPTAVETELPPPAPMEADEPPAPVADVPPAKEAPAAPAEIPPQSAEIAAPPATEEIPAEAPPASEEPSVQVEAPPAPPESEVAEPPTPVEIPAAESAASASAPAEPTVTTAAETPAAAPGPLTE